MLNYPPKGRPLAAPQAVRLAGIHFAASKIPTVGNLGDDILYPVTKQTLTQNRVLEI